MTDYLLTPADELTHTPGEERHFNESVYTNAFDHQRRFGGWIRLGNRVNEGYAELAVCLFLPDGRMACQFLRPDINSNDRFNAGGMSYEVERAHESVVMRYAGEVMLIEDTAWFRKPKLMFERAQRVTCELEWHHTGCSPIYGGAPTRPDQQTMFGRDFSLGHFNQHTAVVSRLRIGGDNYDFKGYGWRDHSWGPRLWQNILFDRGFYVSFGPDRGFTLLKIANQDGVVRRAGVLFIDGRYEVISDLDVFTEWDADKDPSGVTLTVRTAAHSAVIHGRVLNCAPLSNRRQLGHEVMHSRIAEAFTEFVWDGRKGYGMTEYVERLVDGVPVAWPL